MKKPGAFTVCIALLSVFIITACDGDYTSNSQTFEYKLQGRWQTYNRNGIFFGSLIITYDKITIEDYNEEYYSDGSTKYRIPPDDPNRPFGNLPRYFPLDGYSEKTDDKQGKIYIENVDGVLHEIPYTYSSEYDSSLREYVEKLLFYFPGPGAANSRPETLRKISAD